MQKQSRRMGGKMGAAATRFPSVWAELEMARRPEIKRLIALKRACLMVSQVSILDVG